MSINSNKKSNSFIFFGLIVVVPIITYAFSVSDFLNGSQNQSATNTNNDKLETVQSLKVFEPNQIYTSNMQSVVQADNISEVEQNSFQVSNNLVDDLDASSTYSNTDNALYTVQKGDSIYSIAAYFGVSVSTIMAYNHKDIITVHVGDVLEIPPTSGVVYTINKGDTLASISKAYNISQDDVSLFNGLLLTDDLNVGDEIFLPGAVDSNIDSDKANSKNTKIKKTSHKKTSSKRGGQWANGDTQHLNTSADIAKYSSLPKYPGYYIIPSPGATRTQKMHGHNAVDLANKLGSPILAAANGVVRVAKTGGYNFGYGNYIIITHPNGTETVYGHLLQVNVTVGQSVSQGQEIGLLGSTGDSTGPHVHFEIHGAYNPWAW